ncbi:MAG: alpha/beta hydrolase [Gammaproteobacteria bacterium]|nr:alpha/beta hydrolase [Gammaproteobacteria bacterium]
MPQPQLRKIHVNGVELAYFERNQPQPGQPTLLFVHATGFHGRIWDRIIEPLGSFHSIALEQRGHGRSEKRKINSWKEVGEDLVAFVKALELRNLIGIGHSMGAHALVDATAQTAAAGNGPFDRLLLLDPTILAPEHYANPMSRPDLPGGIHPAARRFNDFASVEDMMQRLAGKSAFPLYDPQSFRDYCEHGLVASPNGGMALACPPEVEASVYMANNSNSAIFERVAAVRVPVLVVRAKAPPAERGIMDFTSSPTWPGLADNFRHGRDLHWPKVTHFIPMQAPDAVIGLVREEIEAWRRAGDEQTAGTGQGSGP